ncbi:MAG: gamma carbonic anhydrase family protein [Clostridia bacterium]|nr:gamma carbonic anhydrase family protein [Clostridia bacterium]
MIRTYQGVTPEIDDSVFLAETSAVIGRVKLDPRVNVWYGAVIRGDEETIEIGENTNIQDNVTVHAAAGFPVKLGKNITVGHNAIVHGCTVGDGSMIGMGSCILNGAVIGKGCLIGAGALVKEKMVIPDGSLVVGVPAKVIRPLDGEALEKIKNNADLYASLASEYMEEC